jgi:hypothetical protein
MPSRWNWYARKMQMGEPAENGRQLAIGVLNFAEAFLDSGRSRHQGAKPTLRCSNLPSRQPRARADVENLPTFKDGITTPSNLLRRYNGRMRSTLVRGDKAIDESAQRWPLPPRRQYARMDVPGRNCRSKPRRRMRPLPLADRLVYQHVVQLR